MATSAAATAATVRAIEYSTRRIGIVVVQNALVPLANSGRIIGLSLAGHIALMLSRIRRIPSVILGVATEAGAAIRAFAQGALPAVQLLGNGIVFVAAQFSNLIAIVTRIAGLAITFNPLLTIIGVIIGLVITAIVHMLAIETVQAVAQMAGHRNVETTLRSYSSYLPEHREGVSESVGRMMEAM